MKFQCPYCLRTRFVPAPGRTDEAICVWCGHVRKLPRPNLRIQISPLGRRISQTDPLPSRKRRDVLVSVLGAPGRARSAGRSS